jgi:hypothetical protein
MDILKFGMQMELDGKTFYGENASKLEDASESADEDAEFTHLDEY